MNKFTLSICFCLLCCQLAFASSYSEALFQLRSINKSTGKEITHCTAFCVNPNGKFLTAAHGLEGIQDPSISQLIVVRPKTKSYGELRYHVKIAKVFWNLKSGSTQRNDYIGSDIALLEVMGHLPHLNLPYYIIGNPNELEVFDDIKFLGYPARKDRKVLKEAFHLKGSIISLDLITYETSIIMVQTLSSDGMSGGPLLNSNGNIVYGVNRGPLNVLGDSACAFFPITPSIKDLCLSSNAHH